MRVNEVIGKMLESSEVYHICDWRKPAPIVTNREYYGAVTNTGKHLLVMRVESKGFVLNADTYCVIGVVDERITSDICEEIKKKPMNFGEGTPEYRTAMEACRKASKESILECKKSKKKYLN